MKKIIIGATMVLLAGLAAPTPARADLECFAPPFTSFSNVQNIGQCKSDTPGSMLYDTSAKTWTNPQTGHLVDSPTNIVADSQQVASNQAYADCMKNSFATASACQQSAQEQTGVPPTNTDIKAGERTDSLGNPLPTPPTVPDAPAAPTTQTQQTSNPNAFCKDGTCTYTPLEPLPCPSGTCNQTGNDFPGFVSGVFRVLITVGGLFAVVMIVVAGIGYMISESAVDIDKAKHRAQAALWGLLLLAGSWLILNTINPKLLEFNLSAIGQLQNSLSNNQTTGPSSGQPLPTAQQRNDCESQVRSIKINPDNSWTCQPYAGFY